MTVESDISVIDRLRQVESLRRKGALSDALALCKRIIGDAPDSVKALHLAGAIGRDLDDPELALEFLRRAVAVDPENPDIHCDIGQVLDANGDRADAMDAYQSALVAKPTHVEAHLGLSRIHEADEATEDAIYHLDLAVALDPDELGARERLARLLDVNGRADRAAELRRETMRRARNAVIEAHTKIRTHTLNVSADETDLHRLNWAHALLVYGASGTGLARFQEDQEGPAAAAKTFQETLRVLAAAAEQASAVGRLRRAFETAVQAFAHCHYELALLLERRGNLAGAVYHLEEAWRVRRTPWPQARAKLGEVALKCGETIAEIRDAVASYRGAMPMPAAVPVTRWDFPRLARSWLEEVVRHRPETPIASPRRIAIFAANAHRIQMGFALACVLCARGHTVDFVWMPCLHFDRKYDPEPLYDDWDERVLGREMTVFAASGLPSGLIMHDLRDYAPADVEEPALRAVEQLALADIRHHHRSATVDLLEASAQSMLADRTAKNLDALRRFGSLLQSIETVQLVLFNGGLMEDGAAFHAARAAGVKTILWDQISERGGAYQLSVNRKPGDLDMSAIWQKDAPHHLTTERRERVLNWLTERGGGDYRDPKPRGRLELDARAIAMLRDLDLDPAKPVIGLFPNLTWDPAALDRDVAFDSAREWIIRTSEYFAHHPQWQLVVRLHPDEQSYTSAYVGQVLRDRWQELPANMRIIEPEESPTSYRLLDAVQLGLYYTNTVGLVMAMFGIPAISPALPPFSGFGFTRQITGQDEYFARIEAVLSEPDRNAMTQAQVDLAWCFADLYIHDTAKELPWDNRAFWPSILEAWPMPQVLSESGRAKFDPVFAALAGEIDLPDGIVGRLN
jgi:tetratricopeptide (TPR) repeat protein